MADYSVNLNPGVSVTISPLVPASQVAAVAAQVAAETARAVLSEATITNRSIVFATILGG